MARRDGPTLFEVLPIEQALSRLCPSEPLSAHVELALRSTKWTEPAIAAGIWLYVDELDRSHRISQTLETPTGSYWHAIMHRREGDFWNSKYWYRRVGKHPVIDQLGYDPFEFVDQVSASHEANPIELVELQRREWKTLFDWCVGGSGAGR